eukprot:gene19268-25905_t
MSSIPCPTESDHSIPRMTPSRRLPFQNGYSHCINKLHKVHGLEPYAAHMTWIWGENFGKVNRLREFMYFEDKPSYYLGDDGRGEADFISVDIPHFETPEDFNDWRDIVNDTEKMVQTHITNVEKQLSVLYYAFAIAFALKRTLIMPKIQCWCIQCEEGEGKAVVGCEGLDFNYRTPDVVNADPLVVAASGQVSNTGSQVRGGMKVKTVVGCEVLDFNYGTPDVVNADPLVVAASGQVSNTGSQVRGGMKGKTVVGCEGLDFNYRTPDVVNVDPVVVAASGQVSNTGLLVRGGMEGEEVVGCEGLDFNYHTPDVVNVDPVVVAASGQVSNLGLLVRGGMEGEEVVGCEGLDFNYHTPDVVNVEPVVVAASGQVSNLGLLVRGGMEGEEVVGCEGLDFNYHTPDVVNVDPVVVAASGQVSNTGLQVTLPKGSKDVYTAAQLSKYKTTKRIHFTNTLQL